MSTAQENRNQRNFPLHRMEDKAGEQRGVAPLLHRGETKLHFAFGNNSTSGWRRNDSKSAMSWTVRPCSSPSGISDFLSVVNALIRPRSIVASGTFGRRRVTLTV